MCNCRSSSRGVEVQLPQGCIINAGPVILQSSASGQTWRCGCDMYSCINYNTTFQATSDLPRIYLPSYFPCQISTTMSQNKPRDNYFSNTSFLHGQNPFSLLFYWKPTVTQNFSKRGWSNWYKKLYLLGLKHIANAKAIWGTTFLTPPHISLEHAPWLPLLSVLFFGGVVPAPSQHGRGWEVIFLPRLLLGVKVLFAERKKHMWPDNINIEERVCAKPSDLACLHFSDLDSPVWLFFWF